MSLFINNLSHFYCCCVALEKLMTCRHGEKVNVIHDTAGAGLSLSTTIKKLNKNSGIA